MCMKVHRVKAQEDMYSTFRAHHQTWMQQPSKPPVLKCYPPVFEGATIERRLGHQSGTFMNNISGLIKGAIEGP